MLIDSTSALKSSRLEQLTITKQTQKFSKLLDKEAVVDFNAHSKINASQISSLKSLINHNLSDNKNNNTGSLDLMANPTHTDLPSTSFENTPSNTHNPASLQHHKFLHNSEQHEGLYNNPHPQQTIQSKLPGSPMPPTLSQPAARHKQQQYNNSKHISHTNNNNNNKPNNKMDNLVINLSNMKLDEHILNLLRKGLNFSITPRKILVEDILCNIEYGIKNLPDNIKEQIIQDCSITLRKAKPPKAMSANNSI